MCFAGRAAYFYIARKFLPSRSTHFPCLNLSRSFVLVLLISNEFIGHRDGTLHSSLSFALQSAFRAQCAFRSAPCRPLWSEIDVASKSLRGKKVRALLSHCVPACYHSVARRLLHLGSLCMSPRIFVIATSRFILPCRVTAVE